MHYNLRQTGNRSSEHSLMCHRAVNQRTLINYPSKKTGKPKQYLKTHFTEKSNKAKVIPLHAMEAHGRKGGMVPTHS
jgi:hypothetical protein